MESKMIRVSDDVHDMLCQAKLIPQEPYNDCLKRIIAENNYLKRHYLTEAPRESMYRDLKNFVFNKEVPDDLVTHINLATVNPADTSLRTSTEITLDPKQDNELSP